jgi:hypothetical protein
MEQQVLKILTEKIELSLTGNYRSVYIDGTENASKEITSIIFEFMEWVRKNCEITVGVTWEGGTWELYDNTNHSVGVFTDKDLFQYWWDNVKNK